MPKKSYYKKSRELQKIAKMRINFLFQLANEVFKENSKLSDKYVKIARRIAMKYKIRLTSELKKRFCKHCYKYLVPSVNCRVRLHKHRLIYYCLSCKHYMRHPIKWKFWKNCFKSDFFKEYPGASGDYFHLTFDKSVELKQITKVLEQLHDNYPQAY